MLDRERKLTLTLGTNAGFFTANDAGMRIQESFQDFCVLIIYMLDIVLGKIALFFHGFILIIYFNLIAKMEDRRD